MNYGDQMVIRQCLLKSKASSNLVMDRTQLRPGNVLSIRLQFQCDGRFASLRRKKGFDMKNTLSRTHD